VPATDVLFESTERGYRTAEAWLFTERPADDVPDGASQGPGTDQGDDEPTS
jgi:hypothetical protein